ncbi:MAG: cardiolipin synthase ClsB [Rhodoferax sp.]|nr:cardiolipin synthase ClsB [Rhodoferax sp.]MBP7492174.1 cardiolipin synthase ClsB [Rhodoferax sp.]
MATPPLQPGHHVQLLLGAEAFFPEVVRVIDQCAHEVRMETYIFDVVGKGVLVAETLERAAQRGVAVYLVIDGAGTPVLPPEWVARFNAAGVLWRIYSPLGRIGLLMPDRWRRMHRKLCVVDGLVAFCGGINVLDDFYDPNHGVLELPRLDFHVSVTGPLVQDVHAATAQFWWRLQALRQVREIDFSASWHSLQQALKQARHSRDPSRRDVLALPTSRDSTGAMAALVLRDNLRNRTRIERAYRQAIGEAREEIIIANAYFLPGRKLRKGLIHAAQRGVKVRLLLQGRYEYFMQFHAARPVYGALLKAGVEIHEYAVSFLHAKVAVVDGRWATVGSSNLDPLSLLLAREANVVIEDIAFAQNLRTQLENAIANGGTLVDALAFANRPWRQRLLDRLAFGVMRLILYVTGRRY